MNFSKRYNRTLTLFLLGLLIILIGMLTFNYQAQAQSVSTSPANEILEPVVQPEDTYTPSIPATNATNETQPNHDIYFAEEIESSSEFSWANYFLVIGVMFLALGILWFFVWTLKKRNLLPGGGLLSRNTFKIESSLPLGKQRSLLVVRFLDSRYLLGVTEHQITLIKELETPTETTEKPMQASSSKAVAFAEMLKNSSQKSDK